MIGNFYKSLCQNDNHRILPKKVLQEVSKELPREYSYRINPDTMSYELVLKPGSKEPTQHFDIDLSKFDLPEGVTDNNFEDYIYRTQQVLEIEPYILEDGKRFYLKNMYRDPLQENSDRRKNLTLIYPAEFPNAKPMLFELPTGESISLNIRRVPFASMDHIKLGNVDFPSIKMEWIFPEDTSQKEPAKISISATPCKAENIHDAVLSLKILKAFYEGTLKISGSLISKKADSSNFTFNPEELESRIKFWEMIEQLEDTLHVHFQPGVELTENDQILLTDLHACLCDDKDLLYRSPFYQFHIDINEIENGLPLEELVNYPAYALSFYSHNTALSVMGATFEIYESTVMIDISVERVVPDSDGIGAEIYIEKDKPWRLIRKYSTSEAKAIENINLMFRDYQLSPQ